MAAPSSSNAQWVRGRPEITVGEWVLGPKIGKGGYGTLFYGKSRSSGTLVAVKVASGKDTDMRHLRREQQVYSALDKEQGNGFPRLIHFEEGDRKRPSAIVLNLLGKSLYFISKAKGVAPFSTINCFRIGVQLLDRLEVLHKRGYVHRDISAKNILLGENEILTATSASFPTLHLIDFGLACAVKGYTKPRNDTGSESELRGFIGTRSVCSIDAHCTRDLTPWDDLESLGYVLVLLHDGVLPWLSNEFNHLWKNLTPGRKAYRIWESKKGISTESLTNGMGEEMKEFLGLVRDQDHTEAPEYLHLRDIFNRGIRRLS